MEIRLLGTVELTVDGRVATPTAGKRRAMLAGLALDANHPVSLSRLADMLWTDDPPKSTVANLRSHAAALRRVLPDRLIAHRGAYELRLDPEELDVTEFQRLAGAGTAAPAAEEPGAAIARLTAALAQWRGSAGDGVPRGTTLDNRWASFDEQRLQVFEELTDARLTVGDHGPLLPEIRQHLAAHPFRERAWGQLMLALYRCGDVSAALSAYREAQAMLHDHLGLDPGDELRSLHRAVLDRSPTLAPARPSTAGPVGEVTVAPAPVAAGEATIPRELPARPATFVGRTREMTDLRAAVTVGDPAAVVVCGPAGGGKTALTVRAAHAVADHFPDGQIYVDLGYRAAATPGDVLGRVLRALGVPAADVPKRPDERAGWYRSRVAGRRLLLVVDGVTRAVQVRPLIPAGPGPALIVVSQRRLRSLDGVRRLAVDRLDPVASRAVLAAYSGDDRLAVEPAASGDLVRACAGSALALRISGARLANRPFLSVAALVGQLTSADSRLDGLADEDLSVRNSLATSVAVIRAADELTGPLLRVLGGPVEPVAPDWAAARLGVTPARVGEALEELVDAHLAHRDETGRYRLPELVRAYAAELAATPADEHQLPACRRVGAVAA